jgi:hypothetical protein
MQTSELPTAGRCKRTSPLVILLADTVVLVTPGSQQCCLKRLSLCLEDHPCGDAHIAVYKEA